MPQKVLRPYRVPKARKRYVPKVQKREESIQRRVCTYLRREYPTVYFRSDTASGMMLTEYQRKVHHIQQSGPGQPDLMIFAPSRGFFGLMLELKDEGFELRMKRDGRKVRETRRVTPYGIKVERDYKIRLKGDWKSLHIEKQAHCLEDLNKLGYCAKFAVGEDEAKSIIDWYFERPVNNELF